MLPENGCVKAEVRLQAGREPAGKGRAGRYYGGQGYDDTLCQGTGFVPG